MSTNMKNVIADHFFQMVKERGLDKVTVKDLVESCHISRQTFYYHFQDILDVVEWTARQAVQLALDAGLEEREPEEAIRGLIAASAENHEIIEKLVNSQKREFVERILVEAIQAYLMESMRRRSPDMAVSIEAAQVAVQFYSYGIAGVLMENCGKGNCDPEKLAVHLLPLLRGDYFTQLTQRDD